VNPERTRKTLGLVIAAIAATGQAHSFAIATTLSTWLRTRLDSAVNRFYRLLRNGHVDYLEFATRWLDLLARRPDRKVLLAVDWTEWHHALRLLVAAMVTGKRAIPVFTQGWTTMGSAAARRTHARASCRFAPPIGSVYSRRPDSRAGRLGNILWRALSPRTNAQTREYVMGGQDEADIDCDRYCCISTGGLQWRGHFKQ
jgi:hypothetical protein